MQEGDIWGKISGWWTKKKKKSYYGGVYFDLKSNFKKEFIIRKEISKDLVYSGSSHTKLNYKYLCGINMCTKLISKTMCVWQPMN